jgi:MFS family permease
MVATFPYLVPGGYRALVIGPTFEGLVGGTSTLLATVNAYVSDTTPDGSRATAFARVGGMAMTGFALGPILGSWIINVTGNM